MVVVTAEASGKNVTIMGTSAVTLEVISGTVVPSGGEDKDDDSPSVLLLTLVSVGSVLAVGSVAMALW
jgi:hypothetical protein